MNSSKSFRPFVVAIITLLFIFLIDFIRTEFVGTKFRPLFNVSIIGISILIVLIDTLLREKRGHLPNYKNMFLYSLALLFSYVVYVSFMQ